MHKIAQKNQPFYLWISQGSMLAGGGSASAQKDTCSSRAGNGGNPARRGR